MKLIQSSALHRAIALLACACALTLTSGCFLFAVGAAAGAGAGTVAYVEGKLVTTLNSDYGATGVATNAALTQLQLIKISEAKDAFTDTFHARTAADKKVTIVLTKTGDRLTKVEIRVGMFGDKPISYSILDRIKGNL